MFSSKKALLAALLGAIFSAAPASAQLYFRPFFQPFAYTYSDDYPEEDEAPARHGSRRAVASILAREGFRLVGALGRRGEQIVATGRSRREGDMRFIIDPYEGRIIRGERLGPPPQYDRGPQRNDEAEYVQPLGGSRPVVRELDRDDDAPPARRSRRSARLREAPEREGVVMDGADEPAAKKSERAAAPRRITPEAPTAVAAPATEKKPAAKPAEAKAPDAKSQQATREDAKPVVENKPAEAPPAKPAPRIVYPGPAQAPAPAAPATVAAPTKPAPNTSVVARPAPAASTPASAPMPRTAANSGGGSHRAIVPPTTPVGTAPPTTQ